MGSTVTETVGSEFNVDFLKQARDITLEIINEAALLIKAGMSEAVTQKIIQDLQIKKEAPKSWHPPQIRFGPNTLLPFGKVGVAQYLLKENDIFFIDIGPIYKGHEGDVGRAFAIGNDSEMHRCARDVETIWMKVREHWKQNQISGEELYHFAEKCALDVGNWKLNFQKANGHRIADFPHAAKQRGSIQEFMNKPLENRWILEIQTQHPTLPYGAFYEDLLN